jgi:CubicO group peptidase (beta-lactamase class C family)
MDRRAFVLTAASALGAAAAPVFALESQPDLDAVLAAAMKDRQAPAMGILIIRDGKVAGEAQRGLRRIGGKDAVQPGDVWHIGSDGKAMTATMICRLADRGVLKCDAPLDQMLPDLVADMRPEYRKATLVMLLSHHAGLPHDYHDEKALDPFYTDKRQLKAQRLAYLKLALTDAPVNTPGTAYSYSNTGYILAAAIAEHATGKSYEDLMREEVFRPLGITSAGFGRTHLGQPEGHVKGHPDEATDANPDFFSPPGNIYLSLEDWAKFCIDQIEGAGGHGKLLEPATYTLMQTAQPNGIYALGWGAVPKGFGRQGPILTHDGSDGTWYAKVVLFPSFRSGVLVTANAAEDMGGDAAVKAATRAVIESLAPPAPAEPKPQP